MRKFPERCAAVLGRVIFIGFGVQILLGIVWMCRAFSLLKGWGEGVVCAAQIAVLGVALYFLGGKTRGKIFMVLSALTFPMVAQCTVRPDARVWAVALLLAQIACVRRAMEDETDMRFFCAGLCAWAAAALIRAEYLCIGAIPMVCYGIWFAVRGRGEERTLRRRRILNRWLLILAAGGIAAGVGSLYRDRTRLSTHVASRVAWTTLYNSYAAMPEESRQDIDYLELAYGTYEATGIETNLRPSLEQNLGEREADRILYELSSIAWQNGKGQILKETAWDMAGYLLAPAVLPLQLKGRGYESYSGINYRQILEPDPGWGRLYMQYGCRWYITACVLAVVTGVLTGMRPMSRGKGIPLLAGLGMCALYTASWAGKMDYKNTIFVLCVGIICIWEVAVRGVARTGGKPDEQTR
ncbi:MAG: hypothetical protein NC079_02915 [Clostridium sp.]|nr:hypothetical protein [Acetatifactor muris]MCM1525919.1 hypothetical protein [Bacteroides sp.]MCM1562542.1 hypothetical protein [Clostridium sp.]